jgi:hypothetical protein
VMKKESWSGEPKFKQSSALLPTDLFDCFVPTSVGKSLVVKKFVSDTVIHHYDNTTQKKTQWLMMIIQCQ